MAAHRLDHALVKQNCNQLATQFRHAAVDVAELRLAPLFADVQSA